jgi:flagellar biosynthesis/type III secretory pathway M-ring protein FliF/YscJ
MAQRSLKESLSQWSNRSTTEKAVIISIVLAVVVGLVVLIAVLANKNEYMVSFRDFPGQTPATAEMLARATS